MPRLDDGFLLDHAAGTGPLATQLLAECQAALNPAAAARVSAAEAGFGALLASLPPAPLSSAAFDNVVAQAGMQAEAALPDPIDPATGLPRALSPYLEDGLQGWQRRPGGVEELFLDAISDADVEASLVRLMPGGGIPHHDHGGEELTLVLTGAFHDGHALYRAGELCSAVPGLRHRPAVEGNTPCICLTVSLGQWRPVNPLYGWIDWLTRPARRGNS